MHTKIISLFFLLSCFLPVLPLAAATQRIHVEWEYTPPISPAVTGFKLYQEGVNGAVCTTPTAKVTSMECPVDLPVGTATNFTLTATFDDGAESPRSAPFPFTATDAEELKAMIAVSIVNGPAPLPVTFDASVSTGSVASYLWDFGDGSTSTTATASHTYVKAGTYTAKLTVTDRTGATDTATYTITAGNSVEMAALPAAVISSSVAAKPAPLTVSFDGSGSTAANATLGFYIWDFGDSSATVTGQSVSHTYAAAGTYVVMLFVIDSRGRSNWALTPVTVIEPGTRTSNKPPQAVISATPTDGSAPLTVTFHGGGSTASNGRIVNYVWDFGDNSATATGQSVTHTYTAAGSFIATLQITDDRGATDTASTTVVANNEQWAAGITMEAGEVAVGGEWVRVPLRTSFTNPIVVAGPPSFSDAAPCTVRVRNVDPTGFDIRLAEWDHLDGIHPPETVSYLVMEQGHHTLPDGTAVEAGSFTGSTRFKMMAFQSFFAKNPVVLTTVATMNDATTVSGRLKYISPSGFSYSYQEEESINNHLDETVHYIAWEPGSGMLGTLRYAVGKTAGPVTDAWYGEHYESAFQQPPLLLAGMQDTKDASPAALRVQNQTATGFQVKVEPAAGGETKHSAETTGYIALDQPPAKK